MNKRIIVIIALATLLLFSGCSDMQLAMMQALEEDEVKADAENILNGIENQDSEYIYDTYFSSIDEVSRDDLISGMQEIYAEYEGTQMSAQFYSVYVNSLSNSNGTRTVKTATYLVRTDVKPYLLTLTYLKSSNGEFNVYGINLSPFLDYIVNDRFQDYDAKAWAAFSLNILSYGIMILALILCIKTKIKLKALWIILILLQVGITKTAFPNYFQTSFSFIQVLGISKYWIYAHGGTITSVFFHVFAVIFLFVRKNLNKSYLRQQEMKRIREEQQAMNQQAVQEIENPVIDKEEEAINE